MQHPPLLMYSSRSFLSTSGKPLNSTALVTVNTVALTPIPTASIVIATSVKPGDCRRLRYARRTSLTLLHPPAGSASRRSESASPACPAAGSIGRSSYGGLPDILDLL